MDTQPSVYLRYSKNKQTRGRQKNTNVLVFQPLHPTDARGRSRTADVHRQQVVSGNVLPFPRQRPEHLRPMTIRDALPLPPFLGPRQRHADIASHLRDGFPAVEQLSEGFHNPQDVRDGLSRQVAAIVPVTDERARRTISAMGRAKTPVQFNKDLAMRLKAARVAAGYDTQGPFAKALGIETERYKKWESGRTPIQHEYLPRACELTGKDANYFYGIQPAEQHVVVRRVG